MAALRQSWDLVDRHQIEKALRDNEERLRAVGQELHDNIGQELTALGLLAQTLVDVATEGGPTASKLAVKIAAGLKRALSEVRLLSRGLVPVEVDAAGLMAALKDLARRTDGVQGVRCVFARRERVLVDNNQTATHLYRIAQEAVANALRHSQARHITIRLEEHDTHIVLQVSDDGCGLPSQLDENEGMGLQIMGFRAGLIHAELAIEPAEPSGTSVTCKLQKD
jgi:signal transduction histidine kinase